MALRVHFGMKQWRRRFIVIICPFRTKINSFPNIRQPSFGNTADEFAQTQTTLQTFYHCDAEFLMSHTLLDVSYKVLLDRDV